MPLQVIERAPRLSEEAAKVLRNSIVAGETPKGEQLIEDKIAQHLQVSRIPVREALRQLAYEGLLERRGRSYVVLGITDDDIDEIFSLRRQLEDLAIARTIHNAQRTDHERLSSLVEQMEAAARTADGLRFASLDVTFHTAIYELAHHKRLSAAWQQLAPSVGLLLEVSNTTDRDLRAAAVAHRALTLSIAARDVGAAQQELRGHLDNAARLIGRARANQPRGRR